MAKKASLRVKQNSGFPPHVLSFKEELKATDDKLYRTMKSLTDSKDPERLKDLKKMWATLEKAEKDKYGLRQSDDSWVRYFVIYAHSYSHLPQYFYQKAAERKELVKDLKKHSKALITKLQYAGFDYGVAHSEERQLISFYEDLSFAERRKADKNEATKPKITALLERLVKKAIAHINSVEVNRADKDLRVRLFMRDMTEYFHNAYGKQMRSVVITTAAALLDSKYDPEGLRTILKREKRVKDEEDF